MRKQARAHVDKRFGLTTSKDYITESEWIGHTHTLIVRKTRKAYRRSHREWQRRAVTCPEIVKRFFGPENDLKKVVGEPYDDLVSLKALRLPLQDVNHSSAGQPLSRHFAAIAIMDWEQGIDPGRQRVDQWLSLCFKRSRMTEINLNDIHAYYLKCFDSLPPPDYRHGSRNTSHTGISRRASRLLYSGTTGTIEIIVALCRWLSENGASRFEQRSRMVRCLYIPSGRTTTVICGK